MARPAGLQQRVVDLEQQLTTINTTLGQLQQNDQETAKAVTQLVELIKNIAQPALGMAPALGAPFGGFQCMAGGPPGVEAPAMPVAPEIGGELPQIGRQGVPVPPDEVEVNSVDQFLFVESPRLIEALSQGDNRASIEVANMITSDETFKNFLILWFAVTEELRKFIMLAIIMRNLPLSEARFGLLRGMISDEGFAEVVKIYNDTMAQLTAKKAPVVPEVK